MITINFRINGEPYKVDFRETDNILDTACYKPRLPDTFNGYMFELLTNGLYEGHAQPGDDYSMVHYRLGEGGDSLTWEHMWNSGEDRPFNATVIKSFNVEILSTIDDDMSKLDDVQRFTYSCDAGSMVVSVEGFRTYFGNDYGDGEFPVYYASNRGAIHPGMKAGYRMVGMFEITEKADTPSSAFIESYDCKFTGYEKELTQVGRYSVSCNRGSMLIEYWGV